MFNRFAIYIKKKKLCGYVETVVPRPRVGTAGYHCFESCDVSFSEVIFSKPSTRVIISLSRRRQLIIAHVITIDIYLSNDCETRRQYTHGRGGGDLF